MQDHRHIEIRRSRKERPEPRIVERHALHRRADFDAAQAEIEDRVPQFRDGGVRVLQRNGRDASKAIGLRDEGGQ